MAFRPLKGESGKTELVKAANSVTITKGDALVDDGNGLLTTASAGGNVDVWFVAAETVTTTSSGQEVLCWSTDGVQFEADCDAVWSTTDLLTEADLAAAGQVDPDASTDDVFLIERGIGIAETGTKVVGRFTHGVPNS
jgi:hypothetical protein